MKSSNLCLRSRKLFAKDWKPSKSREPFQNIYRFREKANGHRLFKDNLIGPVNVFRKVNVQVSIFTEYFD